MTDDKKEELRQVWMTAWLTAREGIAPKKEHAARCFEQWFKQAYAPIRLTPTLTIDPATTTVTETELDKGDYPLADEWQGHRSKPIPIKGRKRDIKL